jgi:hypothetical protein
MENNQVHKRNLYYIFIFFIFYSIVLFQYTVDDSFITYRYAKTFISDGIWNWNPSKYVFEEAYTNFSYAVIAIIPEFFHINTLIFFKVFGGLLILYVSFRLIYLISDKLILFIALGFLLLNPYFYIHAYSGLETPLFIVLLFELIIALTKEERVIHEKIFFLILLFLPLTRPEGALYSLIGFVFFIFKNKYIKSKLFFFLIILIGIIYLIIKYTHFGYILPNTFYVKSSRQFEIRHLIDYLSEIKKFWWIFLLLLFEYNSYYKALLVVSIIINIALYGNSDLTMNFSDRFPFQILAPFYLTSFLLIKNRESFFKVSIIAALTLGAIINENNLRSRAYDYPRLRKAHVELGIGLSKYKKDKLTLLLGDAGIIPYFSEWYTYDFIGLANKQIAHNGLDIKYLQESNPDLILLYSTSGEEKRKGFEYVLNQPIIDKYLYTTNAYSFVGFVKLADDFYFLAFLKRNTKKFEEIKNTIQEVQKESINYKFSPKKYLLQGYLNFPVRK